MFQATRRWWRGGRGKVTSRLFVFEFVIVLAGVLAAQALQNWVAHRSAIAAMEDGRGRLQRQLSDSAAYALAWQAAIPCLNQRMDEVMRSVAAGDLQATALERPAMPTFIQEDLDAQSDLLLRKRYGNAPADLLEAMRNDLEFANRTAESLVRHWGRLRLADLRFGPPSEADRSLVRAAAADISAELVGLNFALLHFLRVTRMAGIKPHSDDRFRPARQCSEIWQHRSLAVAI